MLNKKGNATLSLLVVSFSYYAIYNLQMLKSLYYSAVQYGFAINNSQVGEIFSVCGIFAMFAFLCGFLFQNRFSIHVLMSGSLAIFGIMSLILSQTPPYPILLALFGFAGFLVSATFYPAYLSVMQNIGGLYHQGETYAKFYIYSSIFGSVFTFAGFQITSIFSKPEDDLKWLLIFFAILNFAGAVATLLFLPSFPMGEKQENPFNLQMLKIIVKNRRFWLAVIIIFANYVNFSNLTYTLPYLTNHFHLPSGIVNTISILRVYVLIVIAAPLAGAITDRIQSSVRLMKGSFLLYFIALTMMIFLFPNQAAGTILCIIAICFFVSMGKSMSLVVVQEIGLPPFLSGLIFSLISFLAYSPDSFYYFFTGRMLDVFPENGYFYCFLISGIVALVGMIAAIIFQKSSNA